MPEQLKAALVTGSALNIGRATAIALARDGYRVMVTARSSVTDCARTAELIAEAGGEAAVHLADISDPQQARGLVDAAVARFGRLDVLVNNASIRRQTKFSELTLRSGARFSAPRWMARSTASTRQRRTSLLPAAASSTSAVCHHTWGPRAGCTRSPRRPGWWG